MSAIGSTANDSAFSAWVTDVTDVTNRGVVDIVLSILADRSRSSSSSRVLTA